MVTDIATAGPKFDNADWILPGLDIDCLFKSRSFGITLWKCHSGKAGMSVEKIQLAYLISFLHEGNFVLHSEGHTELADPTTAILFNLGATYRSSHPYGCCDHGSSLVIHPDVLLDVMSHFDPSAQERPDALFSTLLARDLSQSFLRHRLIVRGLMQGAPHDPDALDAALLEILGSLASSCRPAEGKKRRTPVESTRARRRYVYDAQLILQERFRERCSLEDLAAQLYVSPFHLCRLFKKEIGMPLHRYLNRLRLREALEHLTAGSDLAQLALSLGFADHSHFTTEIGRVHV